MFTLLALRIGSVPLTGHEREGLTALGVTLRLKALLGVDNVIDMTLSGGTDAEHAVNGLLCAKRKELQRGMR